jgi:hypothetical protein
LAERGFWAALLAPALLSYNIAAFGSPFYIPYEACAKAGASFSQTYSHGFLGMRWLGFRHFLQALATITVSPQIGMLYLGVQGWRVYACNPVLWLSLPGFAIMIWRRDLRAEGLLVAAMTGMYILFITSYGSSAYDWSGAVYFGSRHLIPLLPFLALPLCFGARSFRFVFYPLLAISMFYMLLDTAIEPRVPIPSPNPARDFLLPDYLRGRFAQNTSVLFDGHRNLTNDSTAFNFAKLAGLPGGYQLAPLMLWWLLAGGVLVIQSIKSDDARDDPQLFRYGLGAHGRKAFPCDRLSSTAGVHHSNYFAPDHYSRACVIATSYPRAIEKLLPQRQLERTAYRYRGR